MSDPLLVRATVQRLVYPPGEMPHVEHLTRDEGALLAQAEWDWARSKDGAYVFRDIRLAETRCRELKADGEKHAYPVVWTAWEALERRHKERGEIAEAAALRSAVESGRTPSDVYAELERRRLA